MQSRPQAGESTSTPRLVADVMTTAVVAAHEGAVFKEVALALTRNRVSAIPVIDENRKVLGMVSESDLLSRMAGDDGAEPWGYPRTHERVLQKAHALTAGELMTAPAVTIVATATIADAARLAAQARVRRLPVVDHLGALVGIVTRGDLLRVYLRHDSDIRRDLDTLLRRLTPDDCARLDVGVVEGVISLGGRLENAGLKRQVIAGVQSIPGVVGVTDHLDVAD